MPLFVNLTALFFTWLSQIVLLEHGVKVPIIQPGMFDPNTAKDFH